MYKDQWVIDAVKLYLNRMAFNILSTYVIHMNVVTIKYAHFCPSASITEKTDNVNHIW